MFTFPFCAILSALRIFPPVRLHYHNSQGVRYLGSCRMFSIQRKGMLSCIRTHVQSEVLASPKLGLCRGQIVVIG